VRALNWLLIVVIAVSSHGSCHSSNCGEEFEHFDKGFECSIEGERESEEMRRGVKEGRNTQDILY